jgi:hypothetical protein
MNNDHEVGEVVLVSGQVEEMVELGEVSTGTKGGLGHTAVDGGGGYFI